MDRFPRRSRPPRRALQREPTEAGATGSAGGAAERGVSDAETTAVFSVPRGLEAETSLVSQAFSNLPSDLGKLLET